MAANGPNRRSPRCPEVGLVPIRGRPPSAEPRSRSGPGLPLRRRRRWRLWSSGEPGARAGYGPRDGREWPKPIAPGAAPTPRSARVRSAGRRGSGASTKTVRALKGASASVSAHSCHALAIAEKQPTAGDGPALVLFVHLDSLDCTNDALASVRRGHSRPRATRKYIVGAPSGVRRRRQAKAL